MALRLQTPWNLTAVILVFAAILSAAQARPQQPAHPNFLLITVDTLRPDALGWISGGSLTPNLDALAQSGFRFPRTVTPLPLTLPAHTSLLTGQLPRRHGVRDNGQVVPPSTPTLARHLKNQGYHTAAFVSGFPLQSLFGLDQGFEHYDDTMNDGSGGFVERSAVATTTAALDWLKEARAPWFLWIHYYDPHDPYDPPRAFWAPGPRGTYNGEVAYTDHAIGLLRKGLAQTTSPAGVLTIVTSDHGEALGEHEEETHGYFLYDSTTVVASVLHQPGTVVPGSNSQSVRLIDLAPAALEVLGLPPLPANDGQSLIALLRGESLTPEPAYVETLLPWSYFGWSPLKALRSEQWKLIVAPEPELYDLLEDPAEIRNLIGRERATARRLMAQIEQIEAHAASSASATIDDAKIIAQLRSLGYVGAGSPSRRQPPATGLADPKARIGLRRKLLAGESLLKAGRRREAIQVFENVLREEPSNRFATLRSGVARLQSGDLVGAALRLQMAVKQDPGRAEARFALADALHRSGQMAEAIPQWMELVRLQPRRAQAWSNLAIALAADSQPQQALDAYRKMLSLSEPTARELSRLGGLSNWSRRPPRSPTTGEEGGLPRPDPRGKGKRSSSEPNSKIDVET